MDSSDISDHIVPRKPEHIRRRRSAFLPWHKVRKQFVRKHQWNELVKQLVNNDWRDTLGRPSKAAAQPAGSAMHVSEPLRCLVIPGDDLLDIRSLWNEINPLDCYIRYLGFNERQGSDEEGTRVFVANNTVTSMAGVVPDSQVLGDQFESIAKQTTAYARLKQYGPYHVVNLDLCGSLLPNKKTSIEPCISAIDRLLHYQFAEQRKPWLLFVVTMVEPATVDALGMASFCKPTRENFDSNPAFKNGVEGLFPSRIFENPNSPASVEGITEEEMIRLFSVALGKWLLNRSHASSPEWTVRMRQVHRYKIEEKAGAVMLSLAFQFKPNFSLPPDPTGISTFTAPQSTFPSEAEHALKIAEVVGRMRNIDTELEANSSLREQLTKESADLMESAGFDRAEYLNWVSVGELSARQQQFKEQSSSA